MYDRRRFLSVANPSRRTTYSSVYSVNFSVIRVQCMLEKPTKVDENKEIIEMKVLLENDLRRRFDVDHNKVFKLATLLNSRYKRQIYETKDLITVSCQFLLETSKNSMSKIGERNWQRRSTEHLHRWR